MASEARRQGWRVIAFTFGGSPGIELAADVVVPSRLTEAGPVFGRIAQEGVTAALFSGKFWMRDVLTADAAEADTTAVDLARRAASRVDVRLVEAVVSTLEGMGVTVLDPRPFVGDWLAEAACWSARTPTDAEWRDVRTGLRIAGLVADHGIGQTVVVRYGVVTAVEAVEGTTETIRRGTALAGPGAVVVKTAARDHDYRFDLPILGPETIAAAVAGGAAVVAIEASRVLLLDREAAIDHADRAGLAVVGVGQDG
jgi:DUF1009 family protein